ncbi:unnamed protein product [Rotaria magnacalcarata]|uniref:Glucosidase 2 subunit beta n=3 Tax=Rotaria TaxID=231623 RepID=A0A816NMJ3_9BILA|nr:unnamed protein product [Rotaria magnacalcarata]CAF2135190.1 unnamed protein product [Rotaria magnacalcarata]
MFPLCMHVAVILCSFTSISDGNGEQTVLRGVQTSLLSMYIPSKPFTCLDGSLTVPFEFVNDDYCDCQDGSDEPGTSACSNGQFFCENKGYLGTLIPSHFVGDGICDCCDGSDEYETTIVCNNTCFASNSSSRSLILNLPNNLNFYQSIELTQKFQAVRDARRTLHEAGIAKKKEIIAKSKAITSERQEHFNKLEQDLNNLENDLKEKEKLKQEAEVPEYAAKEKNQKLWEENRAMQQVMVRDQQIREIFVDLDTNEDSLVSIDELQKHTELDINQENEFTVEEVRSILGSDSVNFNEFNAIVFEKISNSYQSSPEPTTPTLEPTPLPEPSIYSATTPSSILEKHGYEEEEVTTTSSSYKDNEEENNNDRDDYHESSSVSTSLEHEKHIHASLAPEYDDETKVLIQIADQARNEYNQVKEKIIQIKRQIQDFKKQSDVDLGPNNDYAPILDECFDYDEREYTYRICMFKTAKQISKGGSSQVTIGYWDSWSGPKDDKYLKMKYSNGATCWNGPPRSLTVTLKCGTEQKLSDVREPSRCEYTMTFETPLACDETIANRSLHPGHVEF